jgi:hypothetical protein
MPSKKEKKAAGRKGSNATARKSWSESAPASLP